MKIARKTVEFSLRASDLSAALNVVKLGYAKNLPVDRAVVVIGVQNAKSVTVYVMHEFKILYSVPIDGKVTSGFVIEFPANPLASLCRAIGKEEALKFSATNMQSGLRVSWETGECTLKLRGSSILRAAAVPCKALAQHETRIPAEHLLAALTSVSFARDKDDLRKTLQSILIVPVAFGTDIVATNTHIMARYRLPFAIDGLPPKGVLLNETMTDAWIAALKGSMQHATIGVSDDGLLVFETHHGAYRCCIESNTGPHTFPKYADVLDREWVGDIRVNRTALRNTLARMLAACGAQSAKLALDGEQLTIHMFDCDVTISERLKVEVAGSPRSFSMNPHYIVRALNVLRGDEIKISNQSAENTALLFGTGSSLSVAIMPMQSL